MIFLLNGLLNNTNTDVITAYFKGLKGCLAVQIVWCYAQLIAYELFSLDINDLIFTKWLKWVPYASSYGIRGAGLKLTGFSWHSGVLASVLVIAYCMFIDNQMFKLLIVLAGLLSKNSTCLLGVLACIGIELLCSLKYMRHVKRKTIVFWGLIGLVGLAMLVTTNLGEKIINEILRLFTRIFTKSTLTGDESSFYHKRYYTGLPEVAINANPFQLLFGCGYGCSGYAFVKVFGQYTDIGAWDVEAQFAADLISRGLIGFLLSYIWTFRILIEGYKIDKRYAICVGALLVESITYNVIFIWVFLFEAMMNIAVQRGISIWDLKLSKREKETQRLSH